MSAGTGVDSPATAVTEIELVVVPPTAELTLRHFERQCRRYPMKNVTGFGGDGKVSRSV